MTNTKLQPIDSSHIKAIINISNLQFGNGFITELEILNHIKSEHKYGFVSSINGKISGFIFGSLCKNFQDLEHIVVSHYNWFEEEFKGQFPIGVIETIGVIQNIKGKALEKL